MIFRLMQGFFNNIFNKSNTILDLISARIINIFQNLINIKSSRKNKFILAYAPYKDKPWILNKILNDLKLNSKNKSIYKNFNSLFKLSLFKIKYGGNILLMHQSHIEKLNFAGFNLSELSTYYTHSRINQKGIKNINKLKRIFCQNKYEYALLKTFNIDESKLVNFPIGIQEKFYKENHNKKNYDEREFDILFSLRYYDKNIHYKSRKRYEFIVNLSNIFSDLNYNVCILGDGWNQLKNSLSRKVSVLEIGYEEYGNIYQNSKIYCNPSLVEGGPLSLIEAFASGCIIFTTPVGLSFNLCLDDDLSFLMPFDSDIYYWKEKISGIIEDNKYKLIFNKILESRLSIIEKSKFSSLANLLEEKIID